MKRIILRSIAALAALLIGTGAWGATVQTTACPGSVLLTCATGISSLVTDGITYNVDFSWGTFNDLNVGDNFPFINDQTNAELTRNAMIAILNGAAIDRVNPEAIIETTYFYVPYLIGATISLAKGMQISGTWISALAVSDPDGTRPYAVFSATTVPVPGAVWLLGSSLGLLGWAQRKVKISVNHVTG